MPRLAGPAGRSSGGLVGAGVVDVEVADELAVVEDGGEAPVEDDGDVAAGPSDADADLSSLMRTMPVALTLTGCGVGRGVGCGSGSPALEGVLASQRLSGVTRPMPWWGRCSL